MEHDPGTHHGHGNTMQGRGDAETKIGGIVRDPVCGMIVDPQAGKPKAEHAGHVYHFCSQNCHDKFVKEPESYLSARPSAEPMAAGTQYTCPMHPEIIRDKPGSCPICGMRWSRWACRRATRVPTRSWSTSPAASG